MKTASRLLVSMLLLAFQVAFGQDATNSADSASVLPLQVQLTKPLVKKNGCLWVNLRLRNRSRARMGLSPTVEIYSTATQAKSIEDLSGPVAWILVYGRTDSFDPIGEGTKLAPGAKEDTTLCVNETFPVKDFMTKAIRQIPVQGRIRILAGYDRIDARGSCQLGETSTALPNAHYHTSRGTRRSYYFSSSVSCSGKAELEIAVPCDASVVDAACGAPPPIFAGERDQWTLEPEAPVL